MDEGCVNCPYLGTCPNGDEEHFSFPMALEWGVESRFPFLSSLLEEDTDGK